MTSAKKQELIEAILDLINHADQMTTSDLQGCVEALVNKLINKE